MPIPMTEICSTQLQFQDCIMHDAYSHRCVVYSTIFMRVYYLSKKVYALKYSKIAVTTFKKGLYMIAILSIVAIITTSPQIKLNL